LRRKNAPRERPKIISMMRVKTQNSSLVPFVAAAEAGGFAVVVDIFLKLFEMKPVWKFASSCGGFIMYMGVYTKILRNKNGRRCEETTREEGVVSSRKFFFGGGWHFWLLVKKSFLSFGSPLLRRRATRQPRTRVQEAPDKLFSLLCRKEKEGKRSAHKNTALSRLVGKNCFDGEMSFRSRPNDDEDEDKEEDFEEEEKKKKTTMKTTTTTMPPPPPRFIRRQKQPPQKKKTKIVLEEEEFAARLEHIIERDYFPNVPQMKDELRLLRAERKGNEKEILMAKRNIQKRMREEEEARSGTSNGLTPSFYYGSTSERGKGGRNTPTTSDTSGIGFSFSSRRRRREEEEEEEEEYDEEEEERTTTTTTTTKLLDSNKTLTQFLASHTSEDNKSFEDILEKINKKRREKNAKLFDAKKIHSAMNVQRLSDGSEGARTKSGALALAEPGQNALFFRPDSALALSKNELANLGATTAPKETFARNTRFNSSNNSHVIEVNEVDEEELALFREQREKEMNPNVNYSRITTPSFTPGRDNFTPIMTWGVLDATPVRISSSTGGGGGGEDIVARAAGESVEEQNLYRFAREDVRELAARKLEKANVVKRKLRKQAQTPSTTSGLSESALRLLRKSTPGRGNTGEDFLRMDVNRAMRQSERRMTSSRRTPSLSARDRTPSMKHMVPSTSARFGKRKPGDGNDDDDKDEGKAIPFLSAGGEKKTPRLTEGLL
jgi:protein DGCR14